MSQELKPIKGSSWLWLIGIVIIVLGISLTLASNAKKIAAQKPTSAPTAESQQWELCWEKKPEHKGKTATKNHCMSARIEKRTNSYLVLSYNGNFGIGTQEGTSIDGVSYDGEWKDSTGWGKFHLKFVSPNTAFGWSDDEGKGEKIPNVFTKK